MENYKLTRESLGSLTVLKLSNTQTGEYLSVLPSIGGMLLNLELILNGKPQSLLDTYSSEQELNETFASTYKGSLLFPFPNRIGDGKYTFDTIQCQLPINFPNEHNAIHGLVYDKTFTLSNSNFTEEFGEIELSYKSDGSLPGYPFSFEIVNRFRIDNRGQVHITSMVKNNGSRSIPAGIGWHPYFRLNGSVDKLQLSFPSDKYYKVDDKMLPTGETETYKEFNELKAVGNVQLDTCFSLDSDSNSAEISLVDDKTNTGITIWQQTGENKYNFLQIYTPPHRNSIAIEPMSCLPNAFKDKKDFQILNAGDSWQLSWGIKKYQP